MMPEYSNITFGGWLFYPWSPIREILKKKGYELLYYHGLQLYSTAFSMLCTSQSQYPKDYDSPPPLKEPNHNIYKNPENDTIHKFAWYAYRKLS